MRNQGPRLPVAEIENQPPFLDRKPKLIRPWRHADRLEPVLLLEINDRLRAVCLQPGREPDLTRAAGLGTEWAPRELRHSFVSILSASGGTNVTETVYRHEIRPALTTGATAMNKILSTTNTTRNTKKSRARSA